jgi:hypothetical protein
MIFIMHLVIINTILTFVVIMHPLQKSVVYKFFKKQNKDIIWKVQQVIGVLRIILKDFCLIIKIVTEWQINGHGDKKIY